jgi:hypothetical protein
VTGHAAPPGVEPFIDGLPGVSAEVISDAWVNLAQEDHYEGRHRRPRPTLMPDGMVYVTEDGYVYRIDGEYPDECIARPPCEVDLPD